MSYLDEDPRVSWRDVFVPQMDAKSSSSTTSQRSDPVLPNASVPDKFSSLNTANNYDEIVSNLFPGLGLEEAPRPREATSEHKI